MKTNGVENEDQTFTSGTHFSNAAQQPDRKDTKSSYPAVNDFSGTYTRPKD